MILKVISDLSNKTDKLTAFMKSSSMGVKDRNSDSIDTTSFASPLETPEEMRTYEAALDEHKFCDQFVSCDRYL